MNRRSFIQSLLMGVVAPAFLPGANRQWKRTGSLFVPDQSLYQKAFIESFFFNRPMNLSQVCGVWQKLPPIQTGEEYWSRSMRKTLEDCSKVMDILSETPDL